MAYNLAEPQEAKMSGFEMSGRNRSEKWSRSAMVI